MAYDPKHKAGGYLTRYVIAQIIGHVALFPRGQRPLLLFLRVV